MFYLYILFPESGGRIYVGSYADYEDAADHGQRLLETGDGYWSQAAAIMISGDILP